MLVGIIISVVIIISFRLAVDRPVRFYTGKEVMDNLVSDSGRGT